MEPEKKLPLISVIIPVYNSEKFLGKCLESVFSQTYPNIEVVVVNDAREGNVEQIIQKYVEKHKNIVYEKHIENKGLFQTRLTGFLASHGEYVAFLDSDDSISLDYYRKMYRTLERENADICLADWVWEYEDGHKDYIPYEDIRNLDINYSNKEILDKFIKGHGYNFSWQVVWNKLIKRTVVEKAFPMLDEFSKKTGHLIMCEDIAFSLSYYMFANKVVNCHDVYYYYFQHRAQSISITSKEKYKKNLKDVLSVFGYFKDILVSQNKFEEYEKDYNEWLRQYYNLYHRIAKENYYLDVYKNVIGETKFDNNKLNFIRFFKVKFGNEYQCYENIIKSVLNVKTISFDIFDTLLLRKTFLPEDIFYLLGFEFRNELSNAPCYDFCVLRKEAEYYARHFEKNAEVNIDDIYSYMVKNYSFDDELAKKLKEREIELEIEMSLPRKMGQDLYDIATINNKMVVYTSDMYLPKDVVLTMLEKNGYSKNNTLLLSNEFKKSKWQGGLYDELLEVANAPACQVVHIGDNWQADMVAAGNKGIVARHVFNVRDAFYRHFYQKLFVEHHTTLDIRDFRYIGYRMMLATVANKLFDFSFVDRMSLFDCSSKFIGYFALGMYTYAFVDWIVKNSNEKNTVHFVARDGYLPMQVYNIVNEHFKKKLPKSHYLYMSRRFLYPMSILEPKDMFSSVKLINIFRHNVDKVLAHFNNDCINEDYVEKIPKSIRIENFDTLEKFFAKIPLLKNCINFMNLQKYRAEISSRLQKIISPNDVLVDIGYSGRCEAVLANLLGYPIDGLYLHSNSDMTELNAETFGFKNKCFYNYKPKITGELRELVFMKLDSSFIGYEISGDELLPMFDTEKENSEQIVAIISTIQENAMNFARDFVDNISGFENILIYPQSAATFIWEQYLHNSSSFDKELFSEFVFEDDIGLGSVNIIDGWNKQNYYPIVNDGYFAKDARLGMSVEEFLSKKSKLKKALFYFLFKRDMFREKLKNKFKRK